MLETHQIRMFYLRGLKELSFLDDWPRIWNKQFKIETQEGRFIKLNNLRPRLNIRSLIGYCVKYTPIRIYMSVLNWLMPERVAGKDSANQAYPIGGEYVVDLDVPQMWRPWNGYVTNNIFASGLQLAYDKVLDLSDKIQENYSNIRIVFSGKRGFHIHVLDFDVRDWTHYNEENPVKSHEVARLVYTKHLQASCGTFNRYHFTLSCDPMRVMTVPGSLNGKTGAICCLVGDPSEFERLTLMDLARKSDSKKYIYNNGFQAASSFVPAHPEPVGGDDLLRKNSWRGVWVRR